MNYMEEIDALLIRWVKAARNPDDVEHFTEILDYLEGSAAAVREALPVELALDEFVRFVPWEVQP